MGALLFSPLIAYQVYGPKYANINNYPTFIEEKVGHLPWLGISVEPRSMEPGHGSRIRIRMMELFLPRGPVGHARKENPSCLMSCFVIESDPRATGDAMV
jgi:hypothetical protein